VRRNEERENINLDSLWKSGVQRSIEKADGRDKRATV
jgi:hypothetical protein